MGRMGTFQCTEPSIESQIGFANFNLQHRHLELAHVKIDDRN